jgi:carbamoyl-phosphate synthase large subunit
MPIIGSSAETIDTAEDRSLFERFLQELGIPQPPGAAILNVEDAMKTAQAIGYPVLVRPSYVLGGRAMEVVQNATELVGFVQEAAEVAQGKPILIDKFLEGREVEVDAICDGDTVLIPGIMEHMSAPASTPATPWPSTHPATSPPPRKKSSATTPSASSFA